MHTGCSVIIVGDLEHERVDGWGDTVEASDVSLARELGAINQATLISRHIQAQRQRGPQQDRSPAGLQQVSRSPGLQL